MSVDKNLRFAEFGIFAAWVFFALGGLMVIVGVVILASGGTPITLAFAAITVVNAFSLRVSAKSLRASARRRLAAEREFEELRRRWS